MLLIDCSSRRCLIAPAGHCFFYNANLQQWRGVSNGIFVLMKSGSMAASIGSVEQHLVKLSRCISGAIRGYY